MLIPALVLRDYFQILVFIGLVPDLVLKDLVFVLVFAFVTRHISSFQRRAIQRRLRLESKTEATFRTFCHV